MEQTHCPIELLKFEEETSTILVEKKSTQKSPRKKTKRVRDRYDSMYRSLLRRFRKFYNVNIDSATRYKALKRYREPSFFIEWISSYVSSIFPNIQSDQLVFDLANLVYPSLLCKHAKDYEEEYPGFKEFIKVQAGDKIQISDLFFNFTFTKMEYLLSSPNYSTLFEYFASETRGGLKEDEQYAIDQMLSICSKCTGD